MALAAGPATLSGISPSAPSIHDVVWKADLSDYGYQAPQNEYEHEIGKIGGIASIDFLSNDVALASFLTRGRAELLDRKDSSHRSATMHLLFLSAKDGKVIAQKAWVADSDAHLIPTHDGEFVIFSGGTLRRYSADANLIKETVLPYAAGQYLPMATSPDGRLVAVMAQHQSFLQLYVVNADTLEVRLSQPRIAITDVALGKNSLVAPLLTDVGEYRSQLISRRIGEERWRGLRGSGPGCIAAPAVFDDDLLGYVDCGLFMFVRGDGRSVTSFRVPNPAYVVRSRAARSGDLVAFAVFGLRFAGTSVILPDAPPITLTLHFFRRYPEDRITPLPALHMEPQTGTFNFALAPDGHAVAILRDGIVEMRPVP